MKFRLWRLTSLRARRRRRVSASPRFHRSRRRSATQCMRRRRNGCGRCRYRGELQQQVRFVREENLKSQSSRRTAAEDAENGRLTSNLFQAPTPEQAMSAACWYPSVQRADANLGHRTEIVFPFSLKSRRSQSLAISPPGCRLPRPRTAKRGTLFSKTEEREEYDQKCCESFFGTRLSRPRGPAHIRADRSEGKTTDVLLRGCLDHSPHAVGRNGKGQRVQSVNP